MRGDANRERRPLDETQWQYIVTLAAFTAAGPEAQILVFAL
jgi:hypothetical protein